MEATTLVIPGLNDSAAELTALAEFIVSVDPDIPWHVSAFRPTYRMVERPPTPSTTLVKAREIGLGAGLNHVYIGNLHGGGGEDTLCPSCTRTIIVRRGFSVVRNLLAEGRCPFCSAPLSGVF